MAFCTADSSDIPVTISNGPGVWEQAGITPRLEELWRAGGLREGAELVYPAGLAVSAAGRVAVTDFSLSEVVVIEPDGRWTGPRVRRGQGPGELATPVASTWDTAGNLVIFDLTAAKVLFHGGSGPAREDLPIPREVPSAILLAGELPWVGVQPNGGIVLQPPLRRAADEAADDRVFTLLRYPPGAALPDTVGRSILPASADVQGYAAPGWYRLAPAIGADGTLVLAGEDARYRVKVFGADGSPAAVICRDAPAAPLSHWERGDSAPDDFPPDLLSELRAAPRPDALAAIGRVFLGVEGRLWVQRARPSFFLGDFLGVPGSDYDVFDPEGRFLGSVRAPDRVRLQGALGDTVFAFATGDLDETEIVAYRLALE